MDVSILTLQLPFLHPRWDKLYLICASHGCNELFKKHCMQVTQDYSLSGMMGLVNQALIQQSHDLNEKCTKLLNQGEADKTHVEEQLRTEYEMFCKGKYLFTHIVDHQCMLA